MSSFEWYIHYLEHFHRTLDIAENVSVPLNKKNQFVHILSLFHFLENFNSILW